VKLLSLRVMIGARAYECDWFKKRALLPGHLPSVKDGDPIKLKLGTNHESH